MTALVKAMSAPPAPPGFTVELDAIAISVNLPAEMRAFLIESDFLDCLDIALLGANESEVVANFKEAIVGSDLPIPFGLSQQKSLKKLWTYCKNAAPSPYASAAPSSGSRVADDEGNVPDGVPEAIEKAWIAKHSFHLPGSMLLIGGDYNRVYNCFMKKNRWNLQK